MTFKQLARGLRRAEWGFDALRVKAFVTEGLRPSPVDQLAARFNVS
jgi:hypothetical protein